MLAVQFDTINLPMSDIYVEDSTYENLVRSWKYLLQETLGYNVADIFATMFDSALVMDESWDEGYDVGLNDAKQDYEEQIKELKKQIKELKSKRKGA